jgi:dTDP-4-dehydrorhamnose 3,5-epimerase
VQIGLAGVERFDLSTHQDERGLLAEVYREEWLGERPDMVQANISLSKQGVLRGLHFHRTQADYWVVLSGKVSVGLFDMREGSPTFGRSDQLDLGEDLVGLYLPAGIAHGYYAIEDSAVLYFVDRYFSGEDEFGVAWDDPEIGIDWPEPRPLVSDRDRSNPPLAEALKSAPAYQALR